MGHAVSPRRRSPVPLVEPLEARQLLSTVPNDPSYNVDGRFTNMSAPEAWDITTGTKTGDPTRDPVVVVLDTGMDVTHPDLVDNLFVNPFETAGDGIDNDSNGFVDDVNGWDFAEDDNDPDDVDEHGTHVAGIIGAKGNNGVGITGVAWDTTLLPIKVLGDTGSGTFEDIIDGLHYAAQLKRQGFNIVAINASLGGQQFIFNPSFERAVRAATDAGILLVVSAGNETQDNNNGFAFPAKFALSEPGVISVAATDRDDQLADFSNFGATSVQVAAPGVDILSTQPGGGYQTLSGTSMAAPEVAGIIALMASANPRASAAQLKQALLDGVDIIPSLDRAHSLPVFVSTGGRVNAFKAVRGILNAPIKTDVATQGAWKVAYGTEGYVIPGETPALPNAASVTIPDAEIVTARPTVKPFALETVAGGGAVNTYYRAAQQMNINYNVPDTLTHRVSLYFNGLEKGKRSQLVEVFDATTGTKLNERRVSNFTDGQYLTYDVTGSVVIRISKLSGKNVTLSGLFIDPTTLRQSGFLGADTTTGGNWRNRFDADGAVLFGRSDFPAAGYTGTITGGQTEVVTPSTTRKGALLLPLDAKRGSVGYLRTADTATVALGFTDAGAHQVTVYAVDFERLGRAQRVELLDADGNLIDQREMSGFTTGQYLTWDVTGNVTIRLTRLQGPDAVLSAIFVDEVDRTIGHYAGLDNTTRGTWRGTYGMDAAYIVGDRDERFLGTGYLGDEAIGFIQTGGTVRILDAETRGATPLLQFDSIRNRVKAQLETRNELDVTLNLGHEPGRPRRVSIYAADYERKQLAQKVEVFDGGGNLLASTDMVQFANGQYASFDLSGDVRFRISNVNGNDTRAVLSAIFFD